MRVQLDTTVPLVVVVDTDTGEVVKVVVVDEEIKPGYTLAVDDDGETLPADAPAVMRAVEIAEAAEWPSWQHGF